jgi:hypothetical protein
MSTTIGNTQEPTSYDRTRINPSVREALAAQTPEIREGIRRIADAPPTPGNGKGSR